MGTGAPSCSNRRKNPSEGRKRKKKVGRQSSKSGRRRRHDSTSPSSRSECSSPSASSSDSDGAAGRASRGRNSKKEAVMRRQLSPSRGRGSSRRQKKVKKASYQGETEVKRHDSRSNLGKGSRQRKGHDRRRRRHRSKSRSTSVGSLDTHSSRSCSTCRSRSCSPERTRSADRSLRSKRKVVKASSSTRGRSSLRREKERRGRRPSDAGYRSRSPRCSSCSHEGRNRSRNQTRGRGGSEFCDDERRLAEKSHPRNLPATSTIVKHSDEMEYGYGSGEDGNEAEIIQDFDDLHTSRSSESCEWERKRDNVMAPLSPSQHAPERRMHDGSSITVGGNGHADKAEADVKREISSSVVVTGPHDGAQWSNRNDSPIPTYAEPRLKSQVSTSGGGGSEADELELLLRQKALENFKKFRPRNSTNANSAREHKYQSIPIKGHEVTTTTGKSEAEQLHESGRPIAVPAKQKSYTSLEHHAPTNERNQFLRFETISDANVPAQACSLGENAERNNKKLLQHHPRDSVNVNIVPDGLFSSSNPSSKEFPAESSGEIFGEDLMSKKMLDNTNSAKAGDTNIHGEEGNRVDASASTDTSCHRSASEFEQKTMSVMHGGEVVQVSYKVYIPKRTPALGRRRLQQ